ncbi:MAG: NAD(P)H-dependent FMN reductase [Akkermansiaceae bacterium]|jgi:chromate reductase
MKKLLIIGASSQRESINSTLAEYAGSQIPDTDLTVLDLNTFEMPLYSQDREEESGIPEEAQNFLKAIQASDGIILSFAEHNGSYTAAFKNILDWTSRHQQKLWSEKPMLLMATSPGSRGGATILAAAEQTFPHLGADVKATFSLPSYYDNYSPDKGITDLEMKKHLEEAIAKFCEPVSS